MPRKGPAPKRPLVIDPVYGSPLVTQLVNKILRRRQEVHRRAHRLRRPRGLSRQDRQRPGRHAQEGARQRQADPRGQVAAASVARPTRCRSRSSRTAPPRWRCAGWSATRKARREKTMTERLMNEILDASQRPRCRGQAPRGHPQDGRVQQGLRALPLVTAVRRDAAPRAPAYRAAAASTARTDQTSEREETPVAQDVLTDLTQGPQHRHHGPHRCRQDHDDRAHPVLHGRQPQDRRDARRRLDHRLDGAGEGARHHDHVCRRRPASGTTTRSTSSTPPATSTSRSRSSARCACSTARSPSSTARRASSPSPRPSGARPTSTTSRASASSTRWTSSARTSTSPSTRSSRPPRRQAARHPAADRRRERLRRRRRPRRDARAGLARRRQG